MIAPGTQVGVCEGCDQPILSGAGITVDAQRGEWHPECRQKHLQTDAAIAAAQAPKRRGRPPKVATPAASE